MIAWQRSPVYGSVLLGPAQRDVLELVWSLTEHGRRPELTLARMAELVGRPISSVATALGRLRALGLIGVATRIGRHGGHRLWRASSSRRALDKPRHRRAIARILARFWRADDDAVSRPVPDDTAPAASGSVHPPVGPDAAPPGDTPLPAERSGESFGELMRRAGIGSWIRDRR